MLIHKLRLIFMKMFIQTSPVAFTGEPSIFPTKTCLLTTLSSGMKCLTVLEFHEIKVKQEWFQRRKQNQLETGALVCYTKWKRLLRFIENIIIVIIVIFYQYLLKRFFLWSEHGEVAHPFDFSDFLMY